MTDTSNVPPQPVGRHFEVAGELYEVIKHIYCIRTPADFTIITQHLSPSLETMLVFNFGEPMRISFGDKEFENQRLDRIAVAGPIRKMMNYELLPNSDLIVVVFRPNGFYRLFQIPADSMESEVIKNPDEMLGIGGFMELWQILQPLSTLESRIDVLMEYGNIFIRKADAEAQLLFGDLQQPRTGKMQPAKAIAVDADLSTRTIQMRFQKYLGFSTKELARYLRFKQVIEFIQQEGSAVDWLSVVDQFGYHDQSHLIRDFRHYLSTTPRKFIQEFLGKEFCVSKADAPAVNPK
ncbi:helix-turn-helix domain-containing protein [Dyadobacter crusticola]|uniref:helix-turn-helix domain-containing protein n=1 Tax=Dyadobacter crusticola TaxID=292407 RepID=UPI0004E186F7|nr:helix-turn-helix domain-containing protein [Dyadobacter crusticola]